MIHIQTDIFAPRKKKAHLRPRFGPAPFALFPVAFSVGCVGFDIDLLPLLQSPSTTKSLFRYLLSLDSRSPKSLTKNLVLDFPLLACLPLFPPSISVKEIKFCLAGWNLLGIFEVGFVQKMGWCGSETKPDCFFFRFNNVFWGISGWWSLRFIRCL